jgi:hypothetical protein
MKNTQNQAHISEIPIQNIESNLYGKNEKTASTEMNFIQKRRKILPNRDRRFKDDENKYVPKGLGSFDFLLATYGI